MDDLISRQDAIDAVVELCKHYTPTKSVKHPHIDFVIEELNNVPSAPLERKKGKWIERDDCWDGIYYECSVCKYSFSSMEGTPSDNDYYFCPNCGSYNGGEEE